MASDPSPPHSVSLPASRSLRGDEEDNQGSSVPAPPPAGFIFMCSSATKPDCYRHRVLGLPRGRFDTVSRIRRDAALFLCDFDTKHLHGLYRADSDGGLDLVPYAFHGRFPAQIEKLRMLFEPIALLPETALPHYVDGNPPAPAVYLPPSASYPGVVIKLDMRNMVNCLLPISTQVPPSSSPYAQYSTSKHVSAPVYSTGPYFAAHQNDPYQPGNVTSQYQQSTYDRAAYVAGHDTVAMNLQLVKGYGFTPSDVTGGATRISRVDESQQAVTYTTHATGSSVHGATTMA